MVLQKDNVALMVSITAKLCDSIEIDPRATKMVKSPGVKPYKRS